MIKSDIIDINGKQYRKTYSDSGFYIERNGMQFSEAVDFIGADFVYTETDVKIDEEPSEQSIEERLSEVEKTTELTATAVEELIEFVMGGEE